MKIRIYIGLAVILLICCSAPAVEHAARFSRISANIASTKLGAIEDDSIVYIYGVLCLSKATTVQSTLPDMYVVYTEAFSHEQNVIKVTEALHGNSSGLMAHGRVVIPVSGGSNVIFYTAGYVSDGPPFMEYSIDVRWRVRGKREQKQN